MPTQNNVREYLKAVKENPTLAEEFAQAVQGAAQKAGFDLDAADVLDALVGTQPLPRPLPSPGDGKLSTMAIGEESKAPLPVTPPEESGITTMAVGEEGKAPMPVTPPPGSGITTMAVGEEGKKQPIQPKPGVTTAAVGEEGKAPRLS